MTTPLKANMKALLRMSILYNILTACNRAMADFIISGPGFNRAYEQEIKDYSTTTPRPVSALSSDGCGDTSGNGGEKNDSKYRNNPFGSLFGLRLTVVLLQYRAY